MVNPLDAGKVIGEHFRQISLEEFERLHDEYVGAASSGSLPVPRNRTPSDIVLRQRHAAPLRLNAYLASGLTGLSSDDRAHLVRASEVIGKVCLGLEIDLFEPRLATDPIDHPDVSDEQVFANDREQVLRSDLVIHVADYPSTGSGEELDIALGALVPIVIVAHGDTRVSRMVTGIPALKLTITYRDLDDLRAELWERLAEIRPILEERKLVFSQFDKNMVGNKVRISREDLYLTREEVAKHSGDVLTAERIRDIEGNNDKVSNPSLLELRTLAAVLKTTVADLVEPDLGERMIALLQEWMLDGVEARYGISDNDQRIVLRRLLYRVLDRTETG
jgi:transcriptional regulator with XRE-family HTH domain